jgi:hypothetical protein
MVLAELNGNRRPQDRRRDDVKTAVLVARLHPQVAIPEPLSQTTGHRPRNQIKPEMYLLPGLLTRYGRHQRIVRTQSDCIC